MLKIEQLSKRYGRNLVLDKVGIDIPDASLNVMVGPNGSGKSTLLRMVAQLERPTEGRIHWMGGPVPTQTIAYLPQNLRFHPLLTVSQIVSFHAEVWKTPKGSAQAALVRWGLDSHARKRTNELSGGLCQRLGLAVLSVRPAGLLLLDEPGLSLDPHWRDRLRDFLVTRRNEGVFSIVTTHLLPEWEESADRIIVCEGAKVFARSPAAENKVQQANTSGE